MNSQVEEAVEDVGTEKRNQAREQVTQLLERVRIRRVVFVDDEFEGDIDDVVAHCRGIINAGSDDVDIEGVDFAAPDEVWEGDLRAKWAAMDPMERRLLAAASRTSTADDSDQPDAGELASLLPDSVEFQPVPPSEWTDSVAQQIVADAAKTGTLVLFDKDLGGVDGLRLVASLFEADASQNVWAGLLTHTVTKDSEHEQWRKLADEPGIDDERFVVISKQHLGPDPLTFPQSLKVTLMARPAADLRDQVAGAIAAGVDDALQRIKEISPQEFERMVFLTSEQEGVWEPDTLLRMFDICIRASARKRLYDSPRVHKETTTLRRLADIRTKPAPTTVHAQTIARNEIYEDSEHLNRVHLPIELGDVFQLSGTTTTKYFILVEQPCDLMVRSDGKRAPELFEVTLLSIVDGDQSGRRDCFELPAFDEAGTSRWAHLGRVHVVPIEAVDYCVFNDDGVSALEPAKPAPALLWPAWKERHKRLRADAKKTVDAVNAVVDDHRPYAMASLMRTGKAHPIKGDVINADRVAYSLRRVGRVLPPYSRPLLTRYALHKAREDYEPRFVS